MLIILEGVDGAGKSTLLHQLAEDHGGDVTELKRSAPAPGVDPFDEYELALDDPELRAQVLDPDHLVVADRWHLGELVYGPLYRGKSRLSSAGTYHVELALEAFGAVRVIVSAPLPIIQERLEDRGEDFLKRYDTAAVYDWYEQYHATHLNQWHRVSSPVSLMTRLWLLRRAKRETHLAWAVRDFPGYVGSPTPATLLVGDQPSGWPTAHHGVRAFTPHTVNSAHYLLDALLERPAKERDHVALVNSVHGRLDELYVATEQPRVVALGQVASQRLYAAGVEYEPYPHPQWVRRFQHDTLPKYARLLLEG